jgi:hypothetical protein
MHSNNNYKSSEPLYIITEHGTDTQQRFQTWMRECRVTDARLEKHRLHIYSQACFDSFLATWTHGFEHLVVWDTWNRRHIYF